MIILLRKKSVRLICILMAAIILVWSSYHFSSERSASMESQTVAVMAEPVATENNSGKIADEEAKNVQPKPDGDVLPIAVQEVPQEPQQAAVTAEYVNESDAIIAMRLERSQNRDRQMEALKELADDPMTSAAAKEEAEKKMIKNSEESAMELKAETLLKTKGYDPAVVMIDFENATVFTKSGLAEDDYAKIGDLVHRSTNFALQQIVIVPK